MNSSNLQKRRAGVSLAELTVAMGLCAIIMLPVIGLLGTSHKVYSASSTRSGGDGARRAGLDAVSLRLADAVRIVSANSTAVRVQFPSGAVGVLSYGGGRLVWRLGAIREDLVAGLSNARFSVGSAAGAGPVAGELLLVELASRSGSEPNDSWSSTQVWIKPTI